MPCGVAWAMNSDITGLRTTTDAPGSYLSTLIKVPKQAGALSCACEAVY